MAKQSLPYRIFQKLFNVIRYTLLSAGLSLFILLFLCWKFASSNLEAPPAPHPERMVLDWKLSGPILTTQQQGLLDGIFDLNANRGLWLPRLRTQILDVIEDADVQGIFITIENVEGSFAQFEELHKLLNMLKQSGKTVHVWSAGFSSRSYLLASAGSKIFMPEVGSLSLTDPAIQLTYFGSALKKIGVGVNVVRAGQYKSAFEAWTHDQPTTESRTMYQALEKSIRSTLTHLTAQGRERDTADVEKWFAESLFTAPEALKRGVIDQIEYKDDVLASLETELNSERYLWRDYHRPQSSLQDLAPHSQSEGLAWIEATGSIYMSATGSQRGEITPKIKKEIDWARDNDLVKAVVLRIDSPGGSAVASELIWKSLEELCAKKPVVVSMGGVAASGGYYIAAPARKILASATTVTGSIGVIGMIPWFQETTQRYGLSFHTITSGQRKSLLNPSQSLSRADREKIQESVSQTYDIFLQRVSSGRSMEKSAVHSVAQGRVWTGQQALDHGLIDGIGGIDEAIREAKILAELDPDSKVPLHRWSPDFGSLSDCLAEASNPMQCFPINPNTSMSAWWQPLQESLEWFERTEKEPLQARMAPLKF